MLLGFKQQFEEKILTKEKRHTIRGKRKRPPKPGDRLDCYVNPRQKSMRLLGRWPCVRVQDIQIDRADRVMSDARDQQATPIWIDGVSLSADERRRLAISDGFESFREMMEFWTGRLPFHGDMIHWNPDQPQPGPKKGKRK